MLELCAGKDILDFGCGFGDQVSELSRSANVTGIDTNLYTLKEARARHPNCKFVSELGADKYDVILSQDAMEHFPDPERALSTMIDALRPGGKILITFGPPWFSPYGAHMHYFCRIPWLHLLFPERAVMVVRAQFRSDGAKRYEEVESGLNKMSIRRFEKLIDRSGLVVARKQYTVIRKIDLLSSIPMLRELVINNVSVVLMRQGE